MTCLDFERPLLELEARIRELQIHASNDPRFEEEIRRLEAQLRELSEQLYKDLSAWQKVQLSRHPDRPHMLDYVERLFDDVLELHGDRCYGDDPAIVAGFARLDGRTVAIVGHQKGRTTREKLRRNFGMAHPEGYRKAVRIMELAARFRRPILTFIDTPGAYPGIGAEERGQSEAIGRAIFTMCALEVPIVSAIIGEGGSGGALALGVANRVLMMEFATYSVITPEGCASILWRDGSKAPLVAERLRLLAEDALKLGIIDEIVPEPMGGAHRNPDEAARRLGQALRRHLFELERIFQRQEGGRQLVEGRRAKFRAMGAFLEE
ncbi:MAG: acetyl-CoA carboxylase carboxyltransferase subunit alpha [Deltaproteobacteria bacterium]|nr:acetyl-CoA carboxylase carboxyltransferase subunit alpha [Deltaproteobacteria bacterium]